MRKDSDLPDPPNRSGPQLFWILLALTAVAGFAPWVFYLYFSKAPMMYYAGPFLQMGTIALALLTLAGIAMAVIVRSALYAPRPDREEMADWLERQKRQ